MTASVAPDVRPALARWLPLLLLGCCVLIYVGWRAFWHYVDDEMEAPDLLPGFRCRVAALFRPALA